MVFGTTCLFLVISVFVHSLKRPAHEILLYPWLLLVFEISLIKEPVVKAAETSRTANQGGTVILNCELKFQGNKPVKTVIEWRKSGLQTPVLLKYNQYPANTHEDFVDRVELVDGASLKIFQIQASDEGWYECSVEQLLSEGIEETKKNGTWVYLNVNTPPTITSSTPSKYKQLQGALIVLYCNVAGSPEPVGYWTKDGHELRSSSRVTISQDNTQVEIKSLQQSDGGTYSCIFTNTIGSVSQRIDLIVEGAAYILYPPSNTTAVQGQRVTLQCGADAFPNNITYRWYFNDRNINTYPGYGQRMYIQVDGTLVLSSVNKDDMGWYYCRPSNGVGQDPEAAAFLNVTYLPRILSMPNILVWALGFTERLDCLVDANPPVSEIIWTKDNKVVQFGHITQLANGSLLIYVVKKSDEGSYSCLPVSSVGHGQTSPLVQVIVRDPPRFTVRPQDRYIVRPGESVLMPCGATGDPQPKITWRKVSGTQVLDYGGRATVDAGGNLTIINIEKQDYGIYECEARNDFTRIVTTTELIVESTTPHAPYNVTVIPSWFDAYVSWIPAYNGGSPQDYIVWYRSLNGEVSHWITMRVVNATNLKVFRLEPDTLYEFKVLSRNNYGDGNFSEVKLVRTLGNTTSSTSRRHNHGIAAGYPTALPTEPSGQTYIPIITRTLGPRPDPPRNTTAVYENGRIRISWLPPANATPQIFYYVIEWTTSNNWKPFEEEIKAPLTSFSFKDGIIPSTTYLFRVYAYSTLSYSLPGDEAVVTTPAELYKPATVADHNEESKGVFLSEAEIGGIVGGLLFLLVAVLLAIIGVICSRKKDRTKGDKYGNVKYMGTAEDMERTTVPHRIRMDKPGKIRQNGAVHTRIAEQTL